MSTLVPAVLKFTIILLSLALLVILTLLWRMASDLSFPRHRTLQAYHQQWLTHPNQHGMRIQQAFCPTANTTCLFVEPDENAGPGTRGQHLRQQLLADGIVLPPYGETHGILVLLHGKNGRKEDLLPVAERFVAAGFRCVIPDMPAHGENLQGSLQYATGSQEQGFANRVLRDSRHFFQASTERAALWGMSMGGAFAVDATARSPDQWQALVIVASFDSLEGIITDRLHRYPEWVQQSLKWLFSQIVRYRDHFDIHSPQPVQWASQINTPVLVVHGTDDQVISLKRGKRLFDAFQSTRKKWLAIPGGTHKNILVTDYPLYKNMSAWYLDFIGEVATGTTENTTQYSRK